MVVSLFLFIFGDMKIKIIFEEGDFDGMHDVLIDLTGHSFSHEELEAMWHKLPEDIRDSFIHWGGNDTVVRDNIYEYYQKLMKERGLEKWED